MSTDSLRKEMTPLKASHTQRPKHFPMKRISTCPSSDFITAEAKRSRLVHTLSPAPKKVAPLSVRNVNCTAPNGNHENVTVAWGTANLCCRATTDASGTVRKQTMLCPSFARCRTASPSASFLVDATVKNAGYIPMNSDVERRSVSKGVSAESGPRKYGCCPLRMSLANGSTPPYSSNVSPSRIKEARNSRKSTVTQRKNGRQTKVSQRNESNALSVYHSFLKRREAAMNRDKATEARTVSTDLASTQSGSLKSSETSLRYSTNFTPMMTSTPQRNQTDTTRVRRPVSDEFKKPFAPESCKNGLDAENTLEVLEALKEEKRSGTMLPTTELTSMAKGVQRQQTDQANINFGSSGTSNTTASNNNNIVLLSKVKPAIPRSKLPGMYPIGAPRASSTPVADIRSREFQSCEENDIVGIENRYRMRHPNESNELSSSPTLSGGKAFAVWRPW